MFRAWVVGLLLTNFDNSSLADEIRWHSEEYNGLKVVLLGFGYLMC